MRGKRELLAVIMRRLGLLDLGATLQKPRLIVFNYHRIADDLKTYRGPFDANVYGPTLGEFEEHVSWISRRYPLAGESEILAMASGEMELDRTWVGFSFDDGYKDNFRHAFPVLKRYRAPALFFIPTQLIDERHVGWWDQVAYLMNGTRRREFNLRGTVYDLARERADSEMSIKEIFVKSPESEYRELLSELSAALDVTPPSAELQDAQLMTWSEIGELSDAGFAIGSHGYSHRVLTTLSDPEVVLELSESKRVLEERLGTEVRSLAYPVGGSATFDSSVKHAAREAGYELGFSFNTGINARRIEDPLNISRVYPHHRPELVAGVTVWPELFSWR